MRSKIIELIGPPGAGKSTIYHSLCKTWKPGSPWVYPDVLVTAKPGFWEYRKWMVYHLRLLMGKKVTKSIPVDYGIRFAGQQRKLARFCWDLLSNKLVFPDREINQRFRSGYFLFTTFCVYQAILEKAPVYPCIIEEGFLQKSFFIRVEEADEQLAEKLLDDYLTLIPLPHAVVLIDTPDIDEIVQRLQGRSKTIASHIGRNDKALQKDIEKWQHRQRKMLQKLEHAGVMIARIDSKQPVKKNAAEIAALLTKINVTQEAPVPAAGIMHPTEP
jgi:thymidylate kinase